MKTQNCNNKQNLKVNDDQNRKLLEFAPQTQKKAGACHPLTNSFTKY
jgi:hypothetical protein